MSATTISATVAGSNKRLFSQEQWPDRAISQPDHSPRENHSVNISGDVEWLSKSTSQLKINWRFMQPPTIFVCVTLLHQTFLYPAYIFCPSAITKSGPFYQLFG